MFLDYILYIYIFVLILEYYNVSQVQLFILKVAKTTIQVYYIQHTYIEAERVTAHLHYNIIHYYNKCKIKIKLVKPG